MNEQSSADVVSILRGLQRRIVVRQFLDALGASALGVAGLVLIVAASRKFLGAHPPLNTAIVTGALVTLFALAAVITWIRRRSLQQVAELVDKLGHTKDRLLTAMSLRGKGGAFELLAQRECAEFLEKGDFAPLIPLHPPRFAAWVAVPLIVLGLLQFGFLQERKIQLAEAGKAQQAISGTLEQVEQLAKQATAAAEKSQDEEIKRMAEELRRSAERLRAETHPEEAQKRALQELSALEELMRDLQRQPSPTVEAKELAKALANLPGMQDVLNALNQDDLAAAQEAMDRALKEQNESKPDQLTEEQVEKSVREAMQGLADRRRLSEALQKLADEMKQRGGEGASHSAMQKLAQMLQQMKTQGQQASGSGEQQRQMTLQELIAALENMKFGDGNSQSGQASNDQSPGGGKIVMMQSFGSANPQGPPSPGEANLPSGRPGSERDFGTSENPFGGKNDAQEKGGELGIKGQLGEGESLSMMLPSAGDSSKSARRYKELYEAIAGAAENSVDQENIPLGSRFLIKRYFESIRPRE